MTNSKKIAGLIGPAMIALTISEAMNFHIWAVNTASVTYLNGALLFVAGLSIIQVHNHWRSWPVLITLTGWFCILGGVYRMFAPEAQQAPQTTGTNIGLGVLFAIGVFLTFKAYGRKESNTGTSKIRYAVVSLLFFLSVFGHTLDRK